MKILITGGTGLIGSTLTKRLVAHGHEVIRVSRRERPHDKIYFWDYPNKIIDPRAIEGIQGVIHLAGATIGKRWTKAYKKELIDSRVKSLQLIEEELRARQQNLQFLISASGANYYGSTSTGIIYKETDPAGEDFLANLCQQWEEAVWNFDIPTSKKCVLRTALVLSPNGGLLKKMLPSFRLGMGAILGNGEQIMPCISLEDMCHLYQFAIENQWEGVYNAVAKNVSQKYFAKKLGKSLQRPVWLKVPAFVLRLMLGEMSIIALKGNALSNEKINNTPLVFKDQNLEDMLRN